MLSSTMRALLILLVLTHIVMALPIAIDQATVDFHKAAIGLGPRATFTANRASTVLAICPSGAKPWVRSKEVLSTSG
jgi:hypothetical protein